MTHGIPAPLTTTRPVDRFLAADPFARDVHPLLAEARAETPVGEVVSVAVDGGPPIRQYYVFDYLLVREVLGDTSRFSNIAYAPQMRELAGRTMLEMDPPGHLEYRGLIAPLFRKALVVRKHRDLVRGVLDDLVGNFRDRGRADLLRQLTLPFPLRVIAGVVGVPAADSEFFLSRAVRLIDTTVDWQRVVAAKDELTEYFSTLIATSRRSPSTDLIGDLVTIERAGRSLSDQEVLSFLMLLMPAGIETTHRASSNLLYALLRHPDQQAKVRADRSLIAAAFDESIRWEPAVAGGMRIAKADVVLGGVAISAGSLVYASLVAANRDPRQFADPDAFDVFRTGPQHTTFGYGPHICIGMHLAKLETESLINTVFDRLPGLRFDPDLPEPFVHGKIYRVPERLDVVFDQNGS